MDKQTDKHPRNIKPLPIMRDSEGMINMPTTKIPTVASDAQLWINILPVNMWNLWIVGEKGRKF